MNKMQSIARIALASLAIYIILDLAKSILSSFYLIGRADELPLILLFMSFAVIGSMIILVLIIAWQLIGHGEKWACKIVAHAQDYEAEENTNWLPTTYRIIAVGLGILFIWWTIPSVLQLVSSVLLRLNAKSVMSNSNVEYKQLYTTPRLLTQLISFIVQLIITIYLLFGAPHFVRWQVKKTLDLCEEFGGSGKAQESKQNQ